MKNINIEKIELVKNVNDYTLYINDHEIGCGSLQEFTEELNDYIKDYLEYMNGDEQQYLAMCDNGHEYYSFYFWSEYEAGTEENREDAIRFWKRHHGRKPYRIINISLQVFPVL